MVRLLSIVPRRSKSVTSLLIICQRWKFLRVKTTLNTYRGIAATKANLSGYNRTYPAAFMSWLKPRPTNILALPHRL
jgi:hypothetical protein